MIVKIAYLVLAHDNPAHLVRLTRALSSATSSVFVHIDQKSNIVDFAPAKSEKVHLIDDRVPVYWGDFSQVEAILGLLKTALSAPVRFDYFVLLSGTDYPLRSALYVNSYFERYAGQEFINVAPMGSPPGKPISRITIYRARPFDPLAVRLPVKLARILKIPLWRRYRSVFGNLIPYGGCTWWALSRPACEYIRSFVDREARIVEFFKHTRCPDEMFFQTILGNSPFKSKVRRNFTYADWSACGSSPADLGQSNLDWFRSSWPVTLDDHYGRGDALFARKFSDSRPDVTDGIDRLVMENEAGVG